MLYVQESLNPNEELIHVGRFNFMYTVQAVFMVLWGVAGSIALVFAASYAYKQMGWFPQRLPFEEGIKYLHPGIRIGAFLVFLIGLLTFVQMMIHRITTEIAITNVRLIYKRGVVARQVGEISVERIEGVGVLQTVMGRLLGYGRLAIRGTGIGEVVLPSIDDPIEFRRAIERAKLAKKENKNV